MQTNSDRLYTAAQVRRLDRSAIDAHGIPGIELMERAGRSVLEAVCKRFPGRQRWLVFCGGGNNGGDGYVMARLAREAGFTVSVCSLKAPEALSGDAAIACSRWRASGGEIQHWPIGPPTQVDVVVDALLGTGLDRAPKDDYAAAIQWINRTGKTTIAVDIPSGLNADTGNALGMAVKADLTVTFIGQKCGLYTADGPDHCGVIEFDTLQTPQTVRDSVIESGILIRENILMNYFPPRARNSHKGAFGWVLGIGGNSTMSGAVRLCGEAALRSGAGKVTLATIPEHAALVNLACPELMVRGVRRGKELQTLLGQVNVIVLGTGLGQTSWSERLFKTCLKTELPVVLDADGLNILARLYPAMQQGEALSRRRWILTPHPAEAGRLLGTSAREVQNDRVEVTKELARKFSAIVVLKGCGTIVADPKGLYAVCPLGNPGMASAGTGDVLAGVIGAFVAQGLDLWGAAIAGVVAHASAGDLAAAKIGERGLIASDIIAQLPAVLNPSC
jgi:NAD(P)H-hydrate epimerase